MITCPNCARSHDVSMRQLGDRVWCGCGSWLLIAQRPGGHWTAIVVPAPVSYPRERKR